MKQDFTNGFTGLLTDLVADLRYYHMSTDTMIAPAVVETMLPPKDRNYKEGDDVPIVCWSIIGGELSSYLVPQPFNIVVAAGLVVKKEGTPLEQIKSGTASIMELVRALGGLAEKRNIAGYKLQLPFEFTVGDPSNPGRQPHPYYWAQLKLTYLVK